MNSAGTLIYLPQDEMVDVKEMFLSSFKTLITRQGEEEGAQCKHTNRYIPPAGFLQPALPEDWSQIYTGLARQLQ